MPNIDKDDANATRYEVTLEEQIALIQERMNNAMLIAEIKTGDDQAGWLQDANEYCAILATLRAHKQIMEAERPVEPPRFGVLPDTSYVHAHHYDALSAYADRMRAERDAVGVKAAENFSIAVGAQERADSLASQLAEVGRLLRAEADNNPFCSIGHLVEHGSLAKFATPMSAELLREVEGRE